jgi:hypothetical protein
VCVCPQATCSEAEAGKRLSDALAAADAAQQAVQEQRSTNTGLAEQLTALQEQLAQVSDAALLSWWARLHGPINMSRPGPFSLLQSAVLVLHGMSPFRVWQ